MVYYNYGRIKAINANIKESLNDLDNAFAVYDKLKDDIEQYKNKINDDLF